MLSFDFQHSFNGSSEGVIENGEYVVTVKETEREFFVGMQLLRNEHVSFGEPVVRRLNGGIVEIKVKYDEAYLDAVGRCKIADVYIYDDNRCDEDTMRVEDIGVGDLEAGDEFMWNGDQAIKVKRVFERSVGVTPTIIVFYSTGAPDDPSMEHDMNEDGEEDLLWLDRDRTQTWLPHGLSSVLVLDGRGGALCNKNRSCGAFAFPATTIGGVTLGPLDAAPSVEHVFQAFKAALAGHAHLAGQVLSAAHPKTCKAMTARKNMPMDGEAMARWRRLSPSVMLAAVRAKFAPSAASPAASGASAALKATGDKTLVERRLHSPDGVWGVKRNGKGANLMGQILMRVRDEI